MVYVRDGESMQCIEVPCTANGKLPEDTLIFENQITLSPPNLDFPMISTRMSVRVHGVLKIVLSLLVVIV